MDGKQDNSIYIILNKLFWQWYWVSSLAETAAKRCWYNTVGTAYFNFVHEVKGTSFVIRDSNLCSWRSHFWQHMAWIHVYKRLIKKYIYISHWAFPHHTFICILLLQKRITPQKHKESYGFWSNEWDNYLQMLK